MDMRKREFGISSSILLQANRVVFFLFFPASASCIATLQEKKKNENKNKKKVVLAPTPHHPHLTKRHRATEPWKRKKRKKPREIRLVVRALTV